MERESIEDGQITRCLLAEEKPQHIDATGGGDGGGGGGGGGGDSGGDEEESGGSSSSAAVTAVVVLSTFVAVSGSFAYGFASGYSSPAESGIMADLGLSTADYSLFGSMLTIGGMLGSIVSGKVADLIGRRFVALWLNIGRVFLGFGIGTHCFAAPAYIGEITPKNSRGAFTAVNQLMLTCGLSIVYFVGNVVTWRILAIIGTIPSLLEVIGLFFIPESPRWLVKVGKEKELEASLRRLRGQNVDISQEAAEIRDYLELAQQLPKSSFIDMFQWKYAHSLTIGVGIVLLAIFGGTVAISYYASSIFESAGCSATLGTTVLAIIQIPFSILGVLLMDKSGRRPLWMISAAGTCVGNILVGLGFLLKDFDQKKEITAALVLAGILVYGSSFSIGISGAPWIILSEMLPIDIKGPAGSFITFLVWASSWIVAYTFNFVLQWSSAGSFFIFAGICGSTVLFVAKLVPETKGRTLEEIQASLSLFQQPKR
ncbi:sugar transporter ERD6-like 5 isoform X3 [Camellia sinensis]|uniref:sugar transporter ERD6-like 5 isoform X3 n=1 Tax=Camellia sinensis TaxID=4442 RepID=UPI0010359701|nr:sugar transporter ERD6-like 5 isoform X3 [Camellia sinensis]